jgi:hypothetical protein
VPYQELHHRSISQVVTVNVPVVVTNDNYAPISAKACRGELWWSCESRWMMQKQNVELVPNWKTSIISETPEQGLTRSPAAQGQATRRAPSECSVVRTLQICPNMPNYKNGIVVSLNVKCNRSSHDMTADSTLRGMLCFVSTP